MTGAEIGPHVEDFSHTKYAMTISTRQDRVGLGKYWS